MAKYFKRTKQNGTIIFVDEKGNVVSEATAKRNLAESRGTGHRVELAENSKDLGAIAAFFKGRGLTEAAARTRALELIESQRRTPKKELEARGKRTRANLEEAFKRPGMFGGMSDAAAKLAAKGRNI
jgi:hypothetical protein